MSLTLITQAEDVPYVFSVLGQPWLGNHSDPSNTYGYVSQVRGGCSISVPSHLETPAILSCRAALERLSTTQHGLRLRDPLSPSQRWQLSAP